MIYIINMYLPNKTVSNYMKQKPVELKEEIGKSTNKLEISTYHSWELTKQVDKKLGRLQKTGATLLTNMSTLIFT